VCVTTDSFVSIGSLLGPIWNYVQWSTTPGYFGPSIFAKK